MLWIQNFEYTLLHSIEAYIQVEKPARENMAHWVILPTLHSHPSNKIVHSYLFLGNFAVPSHSRTTLLPHPLGLGSDIRKFNAHRGMKITCVIVCPFLCLSTVRERTCQASTLVPLGGWQIHGSEPTPDQPTPHLFQWMNPVETSWGTQRSLD